jgi:hypothetical protein
VRLSTFLFLVLGVASLGCTGWFLWHVTAGRREWNELRSYSGRDLQGAGLERIQAIADKLLPEVASGVPVRWVVSLDGPDLRERILLCQALSEEVAHLTLIEESRHCLFAVDVRTQLGRYRGASIKLLRGHPRPDLAPCTFALVMDTQHASEIAVQHYAVINDRPTLVRLEGPLGESLPNDYELGIPLGIVPPLRTPEDWECRLSSASLPEILETLLWLGGIHSLGGTGLPGSPSESPEQIRMFHETARRPDVLRRVRELARHLHPWIAHAAEQARNRLEK